MLLEHRIIIEERPSSPRRLVWGAIAAFGIPLLMGILPCARRRPGRVGEAGVWAMVATGGGLYFLGWRLPLRYLLTDTHLRVSRGLLNGRWVPLDQINLICRASREDEGTYAGFTALSDDGEPVIINPDLPPELRIAFTPSSKFLKTLFWATNRRDFDPWPQPSEDTQYLVLTIAP